MNTRIERVLPALCYFFGWLLILVTLTVWLLTQLTIIPANPISVVAIDYLPIILAVGLVLLIACAYLEACGQGVGGLYLRWLPVAIIQAGLFVLLMLWHCLAGLPATLVWIIDGLPPLLRWPLLALRGLLLLLIIPQRQPVMIDAIATNPAANEAITKQPKRGTLGLPQDVEQAAEQVHNALQRYLDNAYVDKPRFGPTLTFIPVKLAETVK